MNRYATIDLHSGYVWWVGDAKNPLDACHRAALDTNNDSQDYRPLQAEHANSVGGFAVYEVPADYDVENGTDQAEIERTAAFPLLGYFTPIREDE